MGPGLLIEITVSSPISSPGKAQNGLVQVLFLVQLGLCCEEFSIMFPVPVPVQALSEYTIRIVYRMRV